MVIERFSPGLYGSLGVFLPLIAVNCAILGASLWMMERNYNLAESAVFGFGSGVSMEISGPGPALVAVAHFSSDNQGLSGGADVGSVLTPAKGVGGLRAFWVVAKRPQHAAYRVSGLGVVGHNDYPGHGGGFVDAGVLATGRAVAVEGQQLVSWLQLGQTTKRGQKEQGEGQAQGTLQIGTVERKDYPNLSLAARFGYDSQDWEFL